MPSKSQDNNIGETNSKSDICIGYVPPLVAPQSSFQGTSSFVHHCQPPKPEPPNEKRWRVEEEEREETRERKDDRQRGRESERGRREGGRVREKRRRQSEKKRKGGEAERRRGGRVRTRGRAE